MISHLSKKKIKSNRTQKKNAFYVFWLVITDYVELLDK